MLRLGPCVVDLERRTLVRDGRSERLSARDVEVLEYLRDRAGRTVTKEELEREVWEIQPDVVSQAVNVAMRRLRSRIEEDPAQPLHLHTVRGEGWMLQLAAPIPGDRPKDNLPRPLDAFVGRERELEALSRLAEGRTPVATLVGAPGVGKSRLALEFLLRGRSAGAIDEAWWLDGALGPPLMALAACLGVTDPVAALERRGRVFVVVDDAPQAARDSIAALRRALVGLLDVTILLLVRDPLDDVDSRVALGALSPSDARALLDVRLPRAVTLDDAQSDELLAELDGHPLAIELSAADLARFGLPDLLQHLRRGHLRAPIRDALDWAWRALTEEQQRGLLLCAACEGGFELASAEELLASSGVPATELVDVLVSRWLLRVQRQDGRVRYATSPGVRAFSRSRRPDDDAPRAHAAWLTRRTARLRRALYRAGGVERFNELRRERRNIEAALDHSEGDAVRELGLALFQVASVVGDQGWRMRLAEQLEPGDGALGDEAALARVSAWIDATRLDEAEALLERHAHAPGGVLERVRLLTARGDLPGACALARGASGLAPDDEIPLRAEQAVLEARLGDAHAGMEAIDLAEALCVAQEDRVRLGRIVHMRGAILTALARPEDARATIQRALPLVTAVGAQKQRVLCERTLLQTAPDADPKAIEALIDELRALGLTVTASYALADLSDLLAARGEVDEAARAAAQARVLAERGGDALLCGVLRFDEGMLDWLRGREQSAVRRLRDGLAQIEAVGGARAARALRWSLAGLLAWRGETEEARALLDGLEPTDPAEETRHAITAAWFALAAGDDAPARALLVETGGLMAHSEGKVAQRLLEQALGAPRSATI